MPRPTQARPATHNQSMVKPPLPVTPDPPARPQAWQPDEPASPSWWLSIWQRLRWNLLLCLGIAVFLSLVFRDKLGQTLVFSLCVGLSIQALIELGRYRMARWRIGLGHQDPGLRSGWPGWRYMAAWVLFSAFAGHGLGMTLGGWILGMPVPLYDWQGNPRGLAVVLFVTLLVSVVVTYHFYNLGRISAAQADAEAATRLAAEHQLKLLQSQIEPHMLFNTLANVRVLIGTDPPRAQAMLDRMIGYLRATLSASRQTSHPLSAEFDRLNDYLALMTMRMGPRLSVQLNLPDELRALPVPPLLLQPLVENSIKHGLEPKVQGGRIEVSARIQPDAQGSAGGRGRQLLLTVRDTGVGLDQPGGPATPASVPTTLTTAGTGFGMAQVRERLAVTYGGAAQFSQHNMDDGEGGCLARIVLPLGKTDGQPLPQPHPAP